MRTMLFKAQHRMWWVPMLAGLVLLGACSSGVEKPKPVPLGPSPQGLAIKRSWSLAFGEVQFPLRTVSVGSDIALATSQGLVAVVDARTGQEIWRASVGSSVEAGVGFDGNYVAVVGQGGALQVFKAGRQVWRADLGTSVATPPLVAGNRVFVLGTDRTVAAWDAATGALLWQQARPGDPLVLKQPGLLAALGDTLIVGQGAKLLGMNPLSGTVRWEQSVASSRGTNEVEKLMDIPSGMARSGQQVCVRAYQHAVACVDSAKPSLVWSKPSNGFSGLAGDADSVFGVDGQGVVTAYRRNSGDIQWSSNTLRYRQLTGPVVVGRSVVVGDSEGNVHLLAKTDGTPLARLKTDGSAIAAVPVLVGQTLVVITQRGGVFGFVPE
ncbi:outer membrane protein assembly factor BamB [Curvibacter sp. APW13]|uniref:outer membrane protein assembly factor BamB n=1 Tax=Curvibacter sp. APW13 TaxID=3077236 RepID=UPI0028DD94F4|nr:outer membrane protein assembly factor BamB [Curvibacter sp. APW13]MDT8991719.1 outer membrane protein assembly factor BamB [Curvibacter sp. APW13]